jgi:hypothetical protein
VNQQITDDLTTAVTAWVNNALRQLEEDHLHVVRRCLTMDGMDLCVAVRLREGAILLEGINEAARQRVELLREDLAPLRPVTGFATPDTSTKQ